MMRIQSSRFLPERPPAVKRLQPSWKWGIATLAVNAAVYIPWGWNPALVLSRPSLLTTYGTPATGPFDRIDLALNIFGLPLWLLSIFTLLIIGARRSRPVLEALSLTPCAPSLRFQVMFPLSVWIPLALVVVIQAFTIPRIANHGDLGAIWGWAHPAASFALISVECLRRLGCLTLFQTLGIMMAILASVLLFPLTLIWIMATGILAIMLIMFATAGVVRLIHMGWIKFLTKTPPLDI